MRADGGTDPSFPGSSAATSPVDNPGPSSASAPYAPAGSGGYESAARGQPSGATGPTTELPPRYGLLSGAGADSLERERAALDEVEGTRRGSSTSIAARPAQPNAPLPAHWVLLLALLLGLAAGSVIGLLTLV
ncbi:hypothetical protein [Amycolatopsis jiangsuensis]|uniref:Uncharacterized protein n=1 Tax=Amycolatopsis jiangsuensis TaxID=1181879 RepID=A0A840IXB4_9PSEU|nr:hypothetical protein [Amycolatopsis jiangsuensis]MBB4687461.1 hypothetical protein [Amycolatopsis jiangsuensis]